MRRVKNSFISHYLFLQRERGPDTAPVEFIKVFPEIKWLLFLHFSHQLFSPVLNTRFRPAESFDLARPAIDWIENDWLFWKRKKRLFWKNKKTKTLVQILELIFSFENCYWFHRSKLVLNLFWCGIVGKFFTAKTIEVFLCLIFCSRMHLIFSIIQKRVCLFWDSIFHFAY